MRGLRVGVLPDAALAELDADVSRAVAAAVAAATALGATLVELPPDLFGWALDTFVPMQQAEAHFVHHSRGLFPAHADAYGDDVRERLELAASVSLPDYLAAAAARDRLREGVRLLFNEVNVLLTPLGADRTPTFASLADEANAASFRRRTLAHTVPQSLAGIPSCAVRAGFDRGGLPVGVQFSGPAGADELVLDVVSCFCRATGDVQDRRPGAR